MRILRAPAVTSSADDIANPRTSRGFVPRKVDRPSRVPLCVNKLWTRIGIAAVVALVVLLLVRPRGGADDGAAEGAGTDGGSRKLSALRSSDRLLDRAAGARSADISPALTWAALREQPPIEFEGGGVARVAIEADSVPVGGGVLVYCHVEFGEVVPDPVDLDLALGPLDCHLIPPDPQLEHLEEMSSVNLPLPEAGENLYAKALVITEPGEHRVVITRRGKKTAVAEMVVRGVASEYHAWTPFGRSENAVEQLAVEVEGEGETQFETLAVNGYGRALPTADGLSPIDCIGEGETRDTDHPLPRLQPSQPDDGLRIEVTGGGFVLESEREIIVARPDWHLLARWWVNGEPYIPKPLEEQVADQNGLMRYGKRVDVELEFDPAAIGARSGDRIGLQVMHLPNGWSYVSEHGEQLLHAVETLAEDPPSLARMSNRIEFIAP